MNKVLFALLVALTAIGVSGWAQAAPAASAPAVGPSAVSPAGRESNLVVDIGRRLDQLSHRLFIKQQAEAVRRMAEEEALVQSIVASMKEPAAEEKKPPSFFRTLGEKFKKDLSTKRSLGPTAQFGNIPGKPDHSSAMVTPEQLDQAITEAFALIPTDAQILAGASLLPDHLALAGKIVNAETVLGVGPLGFRIHQPACNNLILGVTAHEGPDGRFVPAEGSALSDYYENIPYKDPAANSRQHQRSALEALKRIHQGIRCLSNRSMASVDGSFAGAVLETYLRLHREGKSQAAYGLIDISLNPAILLFDAAKYFEIPQSSRLFCLAKNPPEGVIGRPGVLPEIHLAQPYAPLLANGVVLSPALGKNYAAQCDLSLMRFLLEDPLYAAKATLKLFGIWAEDPFIQGSPLVRVTFQNRDGLGSGPFGFIQRLVDFQNWGEGNCSIPEFAQNGGLCLAHCEKMEGIDQPAGQLPGLLRGTGGFQVAENPVGRSGPPGGVMGAPTNTPDGAPGSLNTLFGVSRSSLGSFCGGGGGRGGAGAPAACAMPTGSQRNFSIDPQLNQLMQCAVMASQIPITVQTDLFRSQGCKLKFNLTGTETETEAQRAQREQAERNLAEAQAVTKQRIMETGPDSLAGRLAAELNARGNDVTEAEVRDGMIARLSAVQHAGLERNLDRPGRHRDDAWGVWDGSEITIDLAHAAEGGEELTNSVIHELIHATIDFLNRHGRHEGGATSAGPALDRPLTTERAQHQIIRRMGFEQCDPTNPGACNSSCGYADQRLTRFTDCMTPEANLSGRNIGSLWCQVNPDACGASPWAGDFSGGVGEQCIVSLAVDPRCAAIYCEPGFCPAYCMGSGGNLGTTPGGGGDGSSPSGQNVWSDFCAANPDRCGGGMGGTDFQNVPGSGGAPPGDPGGPQPPPD